MAAKQNEAGASGAIDYSPLVVFIGVGTCVASMIGLYLFPVSQLDATEALVEKILIALTMALSFLLILRFAAPLSSLRGELVSCTMGAVGFLAFTLRFLWPGLSCVPCVLLSCVAAVGISFLIIIWVIDLSLRPRRLPMSHVAGAFSIGLVIVCGEIFFDPSIRSFAIMSTWAVSSILSFTQWRRHRELEIPPASFDADEVDSRSRIMPESYVMMGTISAQIGFLLGMARSESTIVTVAPFVIFAGFAAAIILAIDAASKRPRITERSLFPFTVPFTIAGYACVYLFGDGVVHIAALCVLAVFAMIYITMGTTALSTHIILERLSPVRSSARARSVNYCGLALGIAVGFAADWAFAQSPLAGVQVTVLAALAYGFVGSFFHRPRFPDSTLKASGSASSSSDKDQWAERCFEVSERHSLSSRQYEVLCLIAQGRNAEYVAHALVISVSTVQTHIRNIYQKLGVHSRQELIDLIEGTKLYGED